MSLRIFVVLAFTLVTILGAWAQGGGGLETLPTCPEGARLIQHDGNYMCAWESDLNSSISAAFGEDDELILYFCSIWFEPVWDYNYSRWWCITVSVLFPPCECSDGHECEYRGGEAVCGYVCGDDEAGSGDDPCNACG